MLNDFDEIVHESCRRLEAEIMQPLNDLCLVAKSTLARAEAIHAAGREAIAARLQFWQKCGAV